MGNLARAGNFLFCPSSSLYSLPKYVQWTCLTTQGCGEDPVTSCTGAPQKKAHVKKGR